MGYRLTSFIASLTIIAAIAAASGDTIELKDGRKIVGDVLRQDERGVVVDLGFTALLLPKSQVIRVITDDVATTQPTTQPTSKPAEHASSKWQLYHTATLQATTIEANAKRFGEAVVMVTTPGGTGSGFVLTADGYLITNYHVIAKETRIKITVFRRTETGFEPKHYRKVKIIALNPFVDLAMLKIEDDTDTFAYTYLGDMSELRTGQDVFAIGNPLGLTRSVSQGIVSITNRNFQGNLYIQTTTDINSGNSGGPLFNSNGEVVGVTSMGYIYRSGLNFAIPVDVVKRFINNRDAYAYDEDNPNSGFRYQQPASREIKTSPPAGKLPKLEQADTDAASQTKTNKKEQS